MLWLRFYGLKTSASNFHTPQILPLQSGSFAQNNYETMLVRSIVVLNLVFHSRKKRGGDETGVGTHVEGVGSGGVYSECNTFALRSVDASGTAVTGVQHVRVL